MFVVAGYCARADDERRGSLAAQENNTLRRAYLEADRRG